MLLPLRSFLRGRLVLKFLLVVLPVFLSCMTGALIFIANENARQAQNNLNARIGSQTASMAATIEESYLAGDTRTTQKLINTMMFDRAIDCVEVIDRQSQAIKLKVPQGLGCKGTDGSKSVDIYLGEEATSMLQIRYNSNEVSDVVTAQREFTILALVFSLIIAIGAICIGFAVIIGRPLKALLASINTSSKTGKKSQISQIPNDELGRVIRAYNEMQTRLAEDAEALGAEVDQRKATEAELRAAKVRLESSKNLLEEQFSQIEEQHGQLKTILDNMPHSVIWLDKDRKIKMRSGRVTEVHCMEEQEYQFVETFQDHVRIVGERGDLGPYESEEELTAMINKRVELLCNETDINKAIRIHFPSKDRWMQVRVASLPDGECILGQHDITDQVAIEQKVEQARLELQEVNNNLEGRIEDRTSELLAARQELEGKLIELSEAQDELIQRGKLAQMGQLTATVAHEIRNPLAAVRTSAHIIKRKLEKMDVDLSKPLDRINHCIERCDNIITELLDFTRVEQLRLKPMNFDNWFMATARKQSENLPAIVHIDYEPTVGTLDVQFDDNRMMRVVINMLNNASEAMVGKTAHPDDIVVQEPKIKISTHKTTRGIEFKVTDTGPGMDADQLSKIFEPLYSTKGFGVGLGVPTMQQIMQQHGGGLEYESEIGSGTTVTAWFPLEFSEDESIVQESVPEKFQVQDVTNAA